MTDRPYLPPPLGLSPSPRGCAWCQGSRAGAAAKPAASDQEPDEPYQGLLKPLQAFSGGKGWARGVGG